MGKIGKFDTDASALARRIEAHEQFGKSDLNAWCFQQVDIRAGQSILDLGCGTGKQTLALASIGCTVTAVDASADAISIVADAAVSRGLTVTTLQSAFDDVPKRLSGTFDRCISAYAIYYANEPELLFRFIHASLVAHGRFFFCGPARDNNMEMKRFLLSIDQEFGVGSAPFMEDYGPRIASSIFSEVLTSTFENSLEFDSAEALWSYWSSHNMYNSAVENRFKAAAASHFSAHPIFRTVKRVRGILALK